MLSRQPESDSIEEEISNRKRAQQPIAEKDTVPDMDSLPELAPVYNRAD